MAVTLNEDTPLLVKLKDEEKLLVDLPDNIDYSPGYREAELERRANEEIRIKNENQRIENEEEREQYYEDFIERVDSGEFQGEEGKPGPQGPAGPPGEKGDSGVYVGNDTPSDDYVVWVYPGGEADMYVTKEYVDNLVKQSIEEVENGSY